MNTQYYDTTDQLADRLTDIATRLRTVGPVTRLWLADISIQVTSHGGAEPAQRIATIDALAAALGLPPAQTRRTGSSTQAGDAYHRQSSDAGITVYGVVPPPVDVQRERLLAALAALDEQEAAQRATAQAVLTPDSPELPVAAAEPVRVRGGLIADAIATTQRVSAERIAEILTKLNSFPDLATNASNEIRDYIKALPEFRDPAHIYADEEITAFVLVDDTTEISYRYGYGWSAVTR